MIRGLVIRPAEADDRPAIRSLNDEAFEGPGEGLLVDALRDNGDVVLELVATCEQRMVGHILFSRLSVEAGDGAFDAVALAPMAVAADMQKSGVGTALIENAHHILEEEGERLSVVLGHPGYYPRTGYSHERAASFESDYQCEALMALAFGDAPRTGRLVYAPAFSTL